MVDDRGNPVVRADRQEFRPELFAGADVDGNDGVGKPEFLQHDRDFPAVRRRRVMEVDHGLPRQIRAVTVARSRTTFVVLYLDHKTWQIDRPIKKARGCAHAVSNHDRRLPAEAGMAGRAQHTMGALEIAGRRAGARQARRHPAGDQTAGRCRHRHRHRGRAVAPAFCPWLSGEGSKASTSPTRSKWESAKIATRRWCRRWWRR